MKLLVVRHAKAETRDPSRWPDDSLRPLSDKGISKFREATRGLAKVVTPDVLMTSPYTRARQTAEILHEVAGWPEPRESAALTDISATQLAQVLGGETDGTLAIVGHEPTVSSLVSLIATGSTGGSIRMKPGAAALLDIAVTRPKLSGELLWLAQPKLSRHMA